MEEKRKRGLNFSYLECELLLELVKQNQDVICSKKNDSASLRKKEATWDSIMEEFNQTSIKGHRDKKELKSKYDNLKKIVKKKILVLEKAKLTGESIENLPCQYQQNMTPVELRIKDILEDEINTTLAAGRVRKSLPGGNNPEFLFVTGIYLTSYYRAWGFIFKNNYHYG